MGVLEELPKPLLKWYRENARVLPWREDPTPYHVWVSEVMLQQTRVAAVLDYYRRFMNAVPDVETLAGLSEECLMKLWQGLGYYSRARNLQQAARQIMEDYHGVFPAEFQKIRALKGIGDYTAGAICSIAFGLPEPAVDGNVLRVVSRITGDDGDISAASMRRKVTEMLRPLIPPDAAGDFTQAMMELGAVVCLPNGVPLCETCPVRDFCVAFKTGQTDRLPVKAEKRTRRKENRTVWLIFYQQKVALRKRPERGLLAGLWEFPNELEETDGPREWGIPISREYPAGKARHIFTHIEWNMTVRITVPVSGQLPEGWVWADEHELKEIYAIPGAFDGLRDLVEQEMRKIDSEEKTV